MSLILTGSTTGETGSISYQWSASDGGVISGATTGSTVTATTAGTYTLVVTDDYNGLTDTETFIVNDLTGDPSLSLIATPAELTFSGQTAIISADTTSIGELIYDWVASDGGNIISGSTGSTITINSGGTYTLAITDTYNGCEASEIMYITTNYSSDPIARITGLTGLTCTATTLTLSGNSSYVDGSTIEYVWSGSTAIDGDITGSTITVSGTGTYSLYVIDTDNSLTSTTVTTVVTDITSTPGAIINSSTTTLSVSDTFIVLSGSSSGVTGTTIYEWSTSVGEVLGTSQNQTIFTADTYNLIVTDDSNGCTATGTTIIGGSATVECSGTTAIISGVTTELSSLNPFIELSGGTSTSDNDLIYSWSSSTQGVAVTDISLTAVTVPDTYSLTVTDSINGCTGYTATTITQDLTPPVATITGGGVITCQTSQVILSGDTSTGNNLTYDWYNSSGTKIGTGVTMIITDAMTPDSFYLIVTDGVNGLTDTSGLYPVTENKNAPTTVTATADPVYGTVLTSANGFSLTFTGSYTGTGTFLDYWKRTGVSGIFSTDAIVTITEPGEYRYRVFDTTTLCGVWSIPITVTRVDTIAVADISGDNLLTCTGTSITLDGGLSSGALPLTYAWSATTQGTAVGDVSTTAVTAPDTYTLTITDNDANVDSTTHVVTQDIVNPVATISTPNGTEIPCDGTLTINGASSTSNSGFETYEWSNGSTEDNITVSVAGTYTLTVTDIINGCTNQDSQAITKCEPVPTPVARITGDSIINCGTDDTVDDLGYIIHIWDRSTTSAWVPSTVTNTSSTPLTWDAVGLGGGMNYTSQLGDVPNFNLTTNSTNNAYIRAYDSIGVTVLNIYNHWVTAIDISEVNSITHLYLKGNDLSTIDVSDQGNLLVLNVGYNSRNGKRSQQTDLTSLDITNNSKLVTLLGYYNRIGGAFDTSSNPDLGNITINQNRITSFDFSTNSKLSRVQVASNWLSSLDLTGTIAGDVTCNSNGMTSITVTGLLNHPTRGDNPLNSIYGRANSWTIVDLSQNINIQILQLHDNWNLTTCGLSTNVKLRSVDFKRTSISVDQVVIDLGANVTVNGGTLIVQGGQAGQRTSASNTEFNTLTQTKGWTVLEYWNSTTTIDITNEGNR